VPGSPTSTPDPALAQVLRAERERQGRSQEDLAHESKLSVASLARIERGQTNPAWTTVRQIAAALNLSLADLAKAVTKAEK
jgi:serine-type D-Ala-D-Ala carboxypeptidase/endopeptidase